MANRIHTDGSLILFDGRNKWDHDLYVYEVLFEDPNLIMGRAKALEFDREGALVPQTDTFTVVIKRDSGEAVITANEEWYTEDSWYAKNPAVARVDPPRRT